MTAAAFQATYSDVKLIKSRKVVQIVFEIPLEGWDAASLALGGMPNPAAEVWCGIARLETPGDEQSCRPKGDGSSLAGVAIPTTKERRKFNELPYPQQAALRCQEPVFWAFLKENHEYAPAHPDDAAEGVRELCGVKSRAEILPNTKPGARWERINQSFEAWKAAEQVA